MLKFRLIGGIFMIGALLLGACGASEPDLTPTATINPDEIRTQAVSTFSANLTLTALAAPSNTPAPTVTPLATFTAAPTLAGGAALGTAPAATTSCYGLAYVSDVTIPDNTPVNPGQKFTKTWKVQNTGSCAWDAGFKFGFVSGDAMGGATYTLPSSIASGAVTDISIAMTAPNKAGTIEGDWQMSTTNGQAFGQIIFVKVVVGGGAAATNTGSGSAATATSTATPTATP
ncbi:MAG TPA: NBR1-Ig-like domain-containing protein [Anaerolineales bacterium]|nr:NBR1-Ig-like domain-containing protein [Anaerolineales bacterium]